MVQAELFVVGVFLLLKLLGQLQIAKTQHALWLLLLQREQSDQTVLVYLPSLPGELLPSSAPGPLPRE